MAHATFVHHLPSIPGTRTRTAATARTASRTNLETAGKHMMENITAENRLPGKRAMSFEALSRNAGFAKGVFSNPAVLYSKPSTSTRSSGDGESSVVSSHDSYELEVKGACRGTPLALTAHRKRRVGRALPAVPSVTLPLFALFIPLDTLV